MADEPTSTPAAEPTSPTLTVAAPPAPDPSAMASPDAALDKVFGTEPKVEPVAAEEPAAEPAAEAPEAKPAGVDRDALTRAIGVLRRDNVPQRIIDELLNDPAELLSWAEKAGERQSNIDKRLRGDKPEPEAKDTPEEPKADPTGPPATDEALAELVRPFAEEMGSERAQETLTKLAQHVRTSTLDEIRPMLEESQQRQAAMSNMLETMLVREARNGLRERFPQVAEDGSWAKVLERAKTLSGTGGYTDMDGLLADASRLEFGEFNLREQQAQLAKTHKARSNGTPTLPTRTRKQAPATPDEVRDAILDEILGE